MASGIEEILTTLYEMVQDAWSLPVRFMESST